MNQGQVSQGRKLTVPRGTVGKEPLVLDMALIDEADRRLHEVRLVSAATATELKGMFNEAANTASKYLAWIEYEILRAKKTHSLNRATVVLEKAVDEAKRLKEVGIKMNEDMRDALIARDEACQRSQDVLDSLIAVKALLESSYWTFFRAHGSIDTVSQNKTVAPVPNFGGQIGQTYNIPQINLMGKDERKE